MSAPLTMLLALDCLEDVYVRGRTVHLVGNGHRFYGNIECESAAALRVSRVRKAALSPPVDGEGGPEMAANWEVRLEILANADMGRNGWELIRLRFTDRDRAEAVREAFLQVAALVSEG